MEQRVSLITLGVADVAASTAFYERLGWSRSKASTPEVTFFQTGGMVLSLYGHSALAADAGADCRAEKPCTGGRYALAHNTRTREEVDAVLQEAIDAGATLKKPAEVAFWGGYSGYFTDPDGHVWEVAWNPGFEITAAGEVVLPS